MQYAHVLEKSLNSICVIICWTDGYQCEKVIINKTSFSAKLTLHIWNFNFHMLLFNEYIYNARIAMSHLLKLPSFTIPNQIRSTCDSLMQLEWNSNKKIHLFCNRFRSIFFGLSVSLYRSYLSFSFQRSVCSNV